MLNWIKFGVIGSRRDQEVQGQSGESGPLLW